MMVANANETGARECPFVFLFYFLEREAEVAEETFCFLLIIFLLITVLPMSTIHTDTQSYLPLSLATAYDRGVWERWKTRCENSERSATSRMPYSLPLLEWARLRS